MKSVFITLMLLFLSAVAISQRISGSYLKSKARLDSSIKFSNSFNYGNQVLYDSLVTYSFSNGDSTRSIKMVYTYEDIWNRLVLEESYHWETYDDAEPPAWHLAYKKEYDYDEKGNLVLSAQYNYDMINSRWIGVYKDEHYYCDTMYYHAHYDKWNIERNDFEGQYKINWYTNFEGKIYLSTFSNWDTINHDWRCDEMVETTYITDKMSLSVEYKFDTITDGWNRLRKTENFYYQDGKDSLILGYKPLLENNDWLNTSKTEFEYADSGLISVNYFRDTITMPWLYVQKEKAVFDSAGNRILRCGYTWNVNDSVWIGTFKYTFSYDDYNRLIENIQYRWDSYPDNWIFDYKQLYEFDNEGHCTHEKNYSWYNGWELYAELDSVFDNGKVIEVIFNGQYFSNVKSFFYDTNGILASYNYYDGTDYNKLLRSKNFYYWNRITTSAPYANENYLTIFPNPACNYITITGITSRSEIKIMDLKGMVRLNNRIANDEQIFIDHLEPGVYLLYINNTNGAISVKKFLKMN